MTDDRVYGIILAIVLLLSGVLGFLLAIAVIDDRERFTIPFTDKTFERVETVDE